MSLSSLLEERVAVWASDGADVAGSGPVCTVFVEALWRGQLSLNLIDMVTALQVAGASSMQAALEIVREAWKVGDLHCYGEAPTEELRAQVSPKCTKLSWLVLRAVLQSFQRENLRCSFDLVLETCNGAFLMDCDFWDLFAAVAMAPEASLCHIMPAPWPVPRMAPGAQTEASLLASVVIAYPEADALAEDKVFPPYSPSLEAVVEEEFLGR